MKEPRFLKKLLHEEKGQSIVLIALAMIGLMAFAGLALDGGSIYSERRQMQNAADAGAFAGARELALGSNELAIYNLINEYTITRNEASTFQAFFLPSGETVDPVAQDPPSGTDCIQVRADSTFSTFIIGVVGLGELEAGADAVACYGTIGSAGNLLPMAVEWDDFQYGQTYQLWGDFTGPGGFGWLDWNGGSRGNPELADNIANPGNSGEWEVGDWVYSGPGVQNSNPVKNALDNWIGQHVTIIIYDDTQGGGANLQYHIAGFAEFILTDYHFTGSPKWIEGSFQRWVEPGDFGGGDYGVSTVRFFPVP